MADYEQLTILEQGIDTWNKWRDGKDYKTTIDLSSTDFINVDLNNAELYFANLSRSNFSNMQIKGAHFEFADFTKANLSKVVFSKTNLSKANLKDANLVEASFHETDLSHVNLSGVDLTHSYFDEDISLRSSDLSGANLTNAQLNDVNLRDANLYGTSLKGAILGGAVFIHVDLSNAYGLEEVIHNYPSTIDTDTLQLSKGKIPTAFLRGCGLSDWEIESAKLYNPDLSNDEINKTIYKIYDLRAKQALQISPLFISYSHSDSAFVDKLKQGLNEKGIRFWRDIHNATAGRLETQIDRAIRQNPTVLLILSKNSIKSDWVQHEVRKARELEKELNRDVLCPIALDDGWKSSSWSQRIMEQVLEYNILDFSAWDNDSTFQPKFSKLLSGLDLFYKKP